MLTPSIKARINEECEEILLADGFEDAFIGIGRQFNNEFAVYDRSKCIEVLMNRDGMTHDEAEEYFSFNVSGAFVGPHTPCFLERMDETDSEVK